MSATPEQIAERLDEVMRAIASDGYGSDCVAPMVAAAALIRAQSEREKVLVDALRGLFARLDHPGNGGQHVNYFLRWPEVEAARAALAGAR